MAPTIASLVAAAERGDTSAADALFAALYGELHALARRELARGGPAMTIGATTLLHEAYLGMVERNGLSFPDRGRFMAYAARVMRGVIVDHARHGRATKRGGQFHMTSLSPEVADSVPEPAFLARISEALDRLAQAAPELAEVVDLKFFCGFSFAEIAAMRRVSERTVQRQWERARIYLHRALGADAPVG